MHLVIKPKNRITNAKEFSKFKLFRTSLHYQLREYLNTSNLHGVKYIAESERSFVEKFTWFCFTVTCAITACIIIFDLWHIFQDNQIITTLDQTNDTEFNFPTVLVCPLIAYDTNRLNKIAERFSKNETDNIEFYKEILKHLMNFNFNDKMNIKLNSIINGTFNREKYLTVFNEQTPLRSIVFDIAVHCNQTLKYCQLAGKEIDCCNNFDPVYSENGFCYGFNAKYIDANESRIRLNKFNKLYFDDVNLSLKIVPFLPSNIYTTTIVDNFSGVFELLKLWKLNINVDVILRRVHMYTAENARHVNIQKRGCIFPDEKILEIYNDDIYTYPDCHMECQVKKSIELCQCIPPFYLQQKFTRYCNLTELECVRKYAENISDANNCIHNCQLNCILDNFATLRLNVVPLHTSDGYVNIRFAGWPKVAFKREVLYDRIDLLVSFGGIGGLFLGFSLLSVIEIMYYFTMRAYFMIYKDRDTLIAIEGKRNLQTQRKYDLSLKPRTLNGNKTEDINITSKFNYGRKRIPLKYKRPKIPLEAVKKLQKLNSQPIQNVIPLTIINYKFRSQSSDPIEYYGYLP